jgi:hypothetical protein
MTCACGCGAETPLAKQTDRRKGHVKGQPVRYVHGHNPGPPKRTPDFEPRDCGYESLCWVWLKKRNDRGYGVSWDGKLSRHAHRVYWERLRGPVPSGLELDHVCNNRPCVCPAHLEVVTRQENVRRRDERRRAREES